MAKGEQSRVTVDVSSSELNEAIKSINIWDGKARLRIEDALKKGTRRVRSAAAQRVAVRSGRLKRSIKSGFSTKDLTGRVYSTLPYAHLVEYGAKSTTIVPRKKKAMKMENGDFTKRSVIPKRSPQPFMRPAYDYAVGDIIKDVEEAVKK